MNEREKFPDSSLPNSPTAVSDRGAQCLHRKGGADSVVFLLSDGRILKEYHQLERRCPGRAKKILEQYRYDTLVARRHISSQRPTLSRKLEIDHQIYDVIPWVALQGPEVRVSAAGVPYMIVDEYVPGSTLKDLLDGFKVSLERSDGRRPYCLDLSSDNLLTRRVRQCLRNTGRNIDRSASVIVGRSLGVITTNVKVQFDTVHRRIFLVVTDLVYDIGKTYQDIR